MASGCRPSRSAHRSSSRRPGSGRRGAGGAAAPLTDVGVYLGWFGGATRLVQAASALGTPLGRLAGVRRVLDAQARRIQHSRAQPSAVQAIRSDVAAVARDTGGRKLAAVHLTGGDPYSFTAPILAWAVGTAAAQRVRPAPASWWIDASGAVHDRPIADAGPLPGGLRLARACRRSRSPGCRLWSGGPGGAR